MASVTLLAHVFVPVPAFVEANKRRGDHWSKKKKRKDERVMACFGALQSLPVATKIFLRDRAKSTGMLVRMVSISVQEPNDDNLAGALKHYRDAIANFLLVPDEDPKVKYLPAWERYKGKSIRGVRIEFCDWEAHLRAEKERIEKELATLEGKR